MEVRKLRAGQFPPLRSCARQLQPAGDDRRIESDSFVQILDGFSMLPVGMDRP
jgi:hypothetical protein